MKVCTRRSASAASGAPPAITLPSYKASTGSACDRGGSTNVVEHGRGGKALRHLERARDAEPGDLARRRAGDVAIFELDGSFGRPQVAGDHVDEGGLAGAVRADDADGLLRR